MDAYERIEELLKPGGEVIGERPRARSAVRRIYVASPKKEAWELFAKLASLGGEAPVQTPTRGSRPGLLAQIPGLGFIGYRETPTPTIDVNVSIEGLRNMKFKFVPTDGGAGA